MATLFDFPLHRAAESGDLQACITIINQNSSAKNVNDPYGRTALHCAAARGHSHIVKQLIASGLDPSVTDAAGKTARDMASAAMQKYQDSIQMLSAPPTSIWGTSLPKPQPQPLQMPKCITPSVSRDHLTCPKGHTLFKGIRQNQFNCDGCGADSTPNEASFKCSACDYDLCVGCASQKAGIRCPQQSEHTLRRFVTPQPGYGCDVCQRKLGLAAVTAGCRLCDYDVCVDCVSNKATVQVIYPNAYAGDVTHPVPR